MDEVVILACIMYALKVKVNILFRNREQEFVIQMKNLHTAFCSTTHGNL